MEALTANWARALFEPAVYDSRQSDRIAQRYRNRGICTPRNDCRDGVQIDEGCQRGGAGGRGLGAHYANHDHALYYENAAGVPWTATYIQAKGDPIADLYEDIAAEEKARATYQWLIDMTDDVDLQDSLKFCENVKLSTPSASGKP